MGVPSTGATFVYVTPGLELNLDGVLLYGYAQLLPYRYVNDPKWPRVRVS
jgi:hypothetical protein